MTELISGDALKTSLLFEGTKCKLYLDVEKQAFETLFAKLEEKAREAVQLKKNFAVGPFHWCEDRPNIVGRYLKIKVDYTLLEPGDEAPAGWTLYQTWNAQLGEKDGSLG